MTPAKPASGTLRSYNNFTAGLDEVGLNWPAFSDREGEPHDVRKLVGRLQCAVSGPSYSPPLGSRVGWSAL